MFSGSGSQQGDTNNSNILNNRKSEQPTAAPGIRQTTDALVALGDIGMGHPRAKRALCERWEGAKTPRTNPLASPLGTDIRLPRLSGVCIEARGLIRTKQGDKA